jgi:XTP/dITP diphosphohydrolase
MDIVIATNNEKKLIQIKEALSSLIFKKDINICSLKDKNYDKEIVENGNTFEENSLIKARQVCKDTGCIAIADDSGICIEAMDNKPGIYSARFEQQFQNREACLNHILNTIASNPNRRCKYVAVIACVFPDGQEIICRGELKGTIADKIVALDQMMTYDPIFIPAGYQTCLST